MAQVSNPGGLCGQGQAEYGGWEDAEGRDSSLKPVRPLNSKP